MIEKTKAVRAIWPTIKNNRGLRDWIQRLESDPRVRVRIIERDANHFAVRRGAGTQRIPSAGGFGLGGNKIEIVVQYNLENAISETRRLGLTKVGDWGRPTGDLSLAQLIAHELGHAYYIAYVDNNAKPGDPMSNYTSRLWENELRRRGQARSFHDLKRN